MKKFLLVITAFLAIVSLGGTAGIIMAQDKPAGPNDARPNDHGAVGQGAGQTSAGVERRHESAREEEREGMMENPKVREEMKRHGDVMKDLFTQIRTLRDKIRKELESKIGVNDGGAKSAPANPEGPIPQTVSPQGETVTPTQTANLREAKYKEELMKLLEPYRADAEQIAGKMSAELVNHHQNLLKIVTDDQEIIKQKITEKILMPPRKPAARRTDQKQGPSDKDERHETK